MGQVRDVMIPARRARAAPRARGHLAASLAGRHVARRHGGHELSGGGALEPRWMGLASPGLKSRRSVEKSRRSSVLTPWRSVLTPRRSVLKSRRSVPAPPLRLDDRRSSRATAWWCRCRARGSLIDRNPQTFTKSIFEARDQGRWCDG